MKCPICGAWSSVLDTREGPHETTRRRRECANGHRFNSVEAIAVAINKHYLLSAVRSSTARRARWARDKKIKADPRSQRQIAAEYGVDQATVQRIKRKKL